MAIFYPDILENNNPNFPLVDATFLKGNSYPLASINNTGSIPTEKRNVGLIVFDSGSQEFYGYKGMTTAGWDTPSNWIQFGTGAATNTGSLMVTGSVSNDTLTFTKGNGSTFNLVVNNVVSSSYALSSSFAISSSIAVSASFALTASFLPVGTYAITASWAQSASQAVSASFVTSASYALSSSQAISSSYALQATSASFAATSSFAVSSSYALSASFANTASFTISSSFATTASYAPNIYNSDGTLNSNRTVNIPSSTFLKFRNNAAGATFQVDSSAGTDVLFTGLPSSISSSLLAIDTISGKVVTMSTSSIQNVVSSSFASTASFAPNLYNSDGTLTGARVLTANGNNFTFNATSSVSNVRFNITDTATFEISGSNRVNIRGLSNTTRDNIIGINVSTGQLSYFNTSSIQNVVSASFAPNLYNSDGTLTGDRVVTLGNNNELRFAPGTGASEFRVSDGPSGGPFGYEIVVSGSGEFRVNSPISASFITNVYVSPAHILTLGPRHPLPSVGIPTGSFAVSASAPPRPYMWDGATWYAL